MKQKDGKQDFVDWHRRKNHMQYEIDFYHHLYKREKNNKNGDLNSEVGGCVFGKIIGEN